MSIATVYTENEILSETEKGCQVAFKALVDLYWQKVYGHALAYCRSVSEAEELTQDVFMAIWINRQKLGSIENFADYIFIITRNKIVKTIRSKLYETASPDNVQLVEGVWIPDKQMEYREVYQMVLEGIELMPPIRKRVFIMSRIDGLTYEQICQKLEISRNTVKEHLVKGLIFLRNYFAVHQASIFLTILNIHIILQVFFPENF